MTRRLAALSVLALALLLAGCSPLYLIKAGIAEAKILAARRPIPEVILDPETDTRTRGLLTIAMEARDFAAADLRLDVGDAYTSFTQLESDTLAHILSGAARDRLQETPLTPQRPPGREPLRLGEVATRRHPSPHGFRSPCP